MLEFISIKEVCAELEYKDNRSVQRWCKNYHVKILSDRGSNRQYVLRTEFKNAREWESMIYLKNKYGKGNPIEETESDGDMDIMPSIHILKNTDRKTHTHGIIEKDFLRILTSI